MRDQKHLAFLRTLPCAACGKPPPSEAHHSTAHRAGLGTKAGDLDAFPLCGGPAGCHVAFHSARGRFRGWDREARRLWQRSMVSQYRPEQDSEEGQNQGDDQDSGVDPGGQVF